MAGWPSGSGSASSIRGVPVSTTTPTTGQVLAFDGTSYAPSSAGGGGITQLTGDVTTASGSGSQAATVAKVQGRAVATTAPTNGQALAWVSGSSQWAPTTVVTPGAWSSSGLTGGAQALPVFSALGAATTLAAPASKVNQVLGWDSNGNLAWVAQMASVMLFAGSQYVTDAYIIERYDVALEAPNGIVTLDGTGIDTATGIV